jgi:hypothetical protein
LPTRLSLLLLIACNPSADGPFRLAPADGQSDVAAFAELRVQGDFRFPDDQPLPEVMAVVDLEDGGLVAGRTRVEPDGLVFVPDGPWPPDRSFAWSIRPAPDEVRRPSLAIPSAIQGTTVFHTDNRLEPLAATVPATEELCLVVSRPYAESELNRLRISRDGEPLAVESVRVLEGEELETGPLEDDDQGLGGLCAIVADAASLPTETIRIQLGATTTLLTVGEGAPATAVDTLRAGGNP